MSTDFSLVKSFPKTALITTCDEVNVEGAVISDGLLVTVGVLGDSLSLLS